MAILPPGVSAESFQSAIREFQDAIGRDWVFTSDDDLYSYRDHFSYIKDQPNELIPSAAVGPDTTEQVQAIVRTANKYKIPLYAISTGKNFAYGGPSPNVRGSVTVDLKRMNRILALRRQAQLRARRAGRLVHRSLSPHPGEQAQRLGRHAGSRLGQPDRQRDGSRHRLHDGLLPRPLRRAHRHGGRAAERRGHAHRHGRDAGVRTAGRSIGTATAPIPPGCSVKAASASSRRWAFG